MFIQNVKVVFIGKRTVRRSSIGTIVCSKINSIYLTIMKKRQNIVEQIRACISNSQRCLFVVSKGNLGRFFRVSNCFCPTKEEQTVCAYKLCFRRLLFPLDDRIATSLLVVVVDAVAENFLC